VIRFVLVAAAFSTLSLQLAFTGRRVPVALPFFSTPRSGEREVRSLAAAWPDRIDEISVRHGEWMLRIDDAWYAWAHGRLLPEGHRDEWKELLAVGHEQGAGLVGHSL
jgi:hypothetical protein